MSEKKIDIFAAAAQEGLNNLPQRTAEGAYISELEHTDEEIDKANFLISKEWEDLMVNLSTTHAARFNKILTESSDKEFTRLYLKILEFAFPKKMRNEFEGGVKEDNNITITVIKQQNNTLIQQNLLEDGS